MHELSITRSVLEIVLEAAGPHRVRSVDLRVGELTGVDQTCLVSYFALLAEGTPAQEAVVRVERCAPVRVCSRCSSQGPVSLPLLGACPDCGGPLRFFGGDELEVVKIEVDDGDTGINKDSQGQ